MKIRTFRTIENGVYKIAVSTEDWSEGDRGLMAHYGEPSVDAGGTFTDGAYSGDIEYTLPTMLIRIMSEVPFVQGFDSRDSADAEARARLWESTMQTRIEAEVTTLRSETDTFTNESVLTI
jgi:hypothetical protein